MSAISFVERPAPEGAPNDWLFVTAAETKGWILDAICREIGARLDGTWDVAYNPKVLPKAGVYFFSHYLLWLDHMRRNPHVLHAKSLVWVTHPRQTRYSEADLVDGLNKSTQAVFACSLFRDALLEKGLELKRSCVVL